MDKFNHKVVPTFEIFLLHSHENPSQLSARMDETQFYDNHGLQPKMTQTKH